MSPVLTIDNVLTILIHSCAAPQSEKQKIYVKKYFLIAKKKNILSTRAKIHILLAKKKIFCQTGKNILLDKKKYFTCCQGQPR